MKVTRTLIANQPDALRPIAEVIGWMRCDLWHRFGALRGVGKSVSKLRKNVPGMYGHLEVDGTIRAETAKDVLNDIKTYEAAAKWYVRKAIFARAGDDEDEAIRLFTLLKSDKWLTDNFLHRQMRKHFRHGQARTRNQFIVRSDKIETFDLDGKLVIKIRIAPKHGEDIILTTTSTGQNVDLKGKNLRIVLKDGYTEIHYSFDKGAGRPCGTNKMGVDKGYTEALADSDGHFHGRKFGKILRDFTDKVHQSGKKRGKLKALERKHRAKGNHAKADRIVKNNLGTKKLDRRREKAQKQLRTEAFKAAHAVMDKASAVGAEDLTSVISRTKPWGRGFNRKMGSWAKGVLAEALEAVAKQRSVKLKLVNAAYTSQVSSLTGRLEGRRSGDRFIAACGRVVQADVNAARNIRDRIDDPDIGRYTSYKEVKKILLGRSVRGSTAPQ